MEEKFDMLLNNQAKMLEHLTLLTKDVNQLKIGHKRLEEGQDELRQGQRELITRVTVLEEGQDELRQGQQELITRVTVLEEGQDELRQGQQELIARVTSLEKGQKELKQGQAEIKREQHFMKEDIGWMHTDYYQTKRKVEKLEEMQVQTA